MASKKEKVVTLLFLLVILAIAADLRLYQNATLPGWYNDEGTIINIASNMAQGRLEYLGVQGSILFSSRQPLFVGMLALLFKVFGTGIQTLRTFTGLLGVLNTLLIYLILARKDRTLALVSSFAFAVFPEAILYSRIGFGYNLVATLLLLAFWAAWKYLEGRRRNYALLMALLMGLAFASEIAALAFGLVLILLVLWRRWQDVFLAGLVFLLPFGIYSGVMLLLSPKAYLFDLNFIFLRLSMAPISLKGITYIVNMARMYLVLFTLAGMVGIAFIRDSRVQKLLALFIFVPLLVMSTSNGITGLGEHVMIPLLPFLSIGLGGLLLEVIDRLQEFSRFLTDVIFSRFKAIDKGKAKVVCTGIVELFILISLLLLPATGYLYVTNSDFRAGVYPTKLDDYVLDPAEAQAVAGYLNAHASRDDVVLASPALAWGIQAHATDYLISLAYSGASTRFFPTDLPHDRFAFDPDYRQAEYIVIDNIWRNWGESYVPDLVRVRQLAETAPVVFQTQHITVYKLH